MTERSSGRPPFLLYGFHAVKEALLSGKRSCRRLWVSKDRKDAEELLALARKRRVEVRLEEPRKLERLAGGRNHQGAVLEVEPPELLELEDALSARPPGQTTLWIAVDGVTDPQNLGSIIRSAACLGGSAVLIPEHRTAPLTPTVEKVASGAVEKLALVGVGNLNQAILALKERSFWVYGADGSGKPVDGLSFKGPVLLIIGSEGEGLREKTRGHCDELVSIPQAPGGVESLNASCAAAILLYEIGRKLRATAGGTP